MIKSKVRVRTMSKSANRIVLVLTSCIYARVERCNDESVTYDLHSCQCVFCDGIQVCTFCFYEQTFEVWKWLEKPFASILHSWFDTLMTFTPTSRSFVVFHLQKICLNSKAPLMKSFCWRACDRLGKIEKMFDFTWQVIDIGISKGINFYYFFRFSVNWQD